MAVKIDQKIVAYQVKAEESAPYEAKASNDEKLIDNDIMHENVSRPDVLIGSTYKIKTPLSDHALYITVNDVVLNEGTDREKRHPYEVFINSKNMDQFQWIVALTRVISAVFRKGGDVTFLVEELKAVFDPKGGYFKPGGVFMPSLVAEIGTAIESHLKSIGLIEDKTLDEHQQKLVDSKRKEYEERHGAKNNETAGDFPETAQLCSKCNTKALVLMDGCMTCLSCGDSKCG